MSYLLLHASRICGVGRKRESKHVIFLLMFILLWCGWLFYKGGIVSLRTSVGGSGHLNIAGRWLSLGSRGVVGRLVGWFCHGYWQRGQGWCWFMFSYAVRFP